MIEIVDASSARSFLTGNEGDVRPQPLILPLSVNLLAPEQERLQILLISGPVWVRETIHDLHRRGFADANDWSGLLPGANAGEVVSILTRRRQRSQGESS